MTSTETEEIHDVLFDTVASLEELVVSQEGKVPMRLMETQRTEGYHETRKALLNDARGQLRRAKTYMLRTGVIKNKVQRDSQNVEGLYFSSVEKGQDRSGQDTPKSPRRRPSSSRLLLAFMFLSAWAFTCFDRLLGGCFVAGIAGFFAYCHIVGVRFEE